MKKKWKKDSLIKVPDAAKYDLYENYQKLIDKSLAVFVGATNAPCSIISNEHFKRMIQALDARYHIPGHTCLQSLIDPSFKNNETSHTKCYDCCL